MEEAQEIRMKFPKEFHTYFRYKFLWPCVYTFLVQISCEFILLIFMLIFMGNLKNKFHLQFSRIFLRKNILKRQKLIPIEISLLSSKIINITILRIYIKEKYF